MPALLSADKAMFDRMLQAVLRSESVCSFARTSARPQELQLLFARHASIICVMTHKHLVGVPWMKGGP